MTADARLQVPAADAAVDAPSNPVTCGEVTPGSGAMTGIVYEREAFRSYGADGPYFNGLAGAAIEVSGMTPATSEPCGSYRIEPPLYAAVAVRKEGFADSGFAPHGPNHLRQDIGLYPAVGVAPRPGFMKGFITLQDVDGTFAWPLAGFARAAGLGATHVAYSDDIVLTDYNFSRGVAKFSTAELNAVGDYRTLADGAHALGLGLILRIRIFSMDVDYYNDVGGHVMNEAFWDAWFAAFTPAMVDLATRARDAGVDVIALHGLLGAARQPVARLQTTIAAMRAAGYTGKLMYVGSFIPDTVGFFSDLTRANLDDPSGFEAAFDHVGLWIRNLYLGGSPRSRAAVSSMLHGLAASRTKPVVLLIDTTSTAEATTSDADVNPCDTAAAADLDFAQQADVYQAAFEAVNAGANVGGVVSNGYEVEAEICSWTTILSAEPSANVYGKPAEAVLRWWFEKL